MASASSPLRQVELPEEYPVEWDELEKEDGLTPDERRELHARLARNRQDAPIPAFRL
jgi:hypothetical protein